MLKKNIGYRAVKCLKHYIDRLTGDHCPARLFEDKPTIDFYPRVSGDFRVLKTREKRIVTKDIGPFCAKETILQGRDGTVYRSRQLRRLTPYRATFGYDVLVHVGRPFCALSQRTKNNCGSGP